MPTIERSQPRRVAIAGLPGVQLEGAKTALSEGAGVAAAKFRTAQVTGAAWGQVGEAVQGVGVSLYAKQQEERRKAQAEAKEKADTLAVVAAQNKMNAFRRERVHGQGGALSKVGKDAMGEPELVDADFEKTASEVMQGLATPEQQVAFQRWLVGERDSINLTVLDHVRREMQVFAGNELNASTKNAVDSAIRENMLDIRQGAVKLAEAEQTLRKIGPSVGLGPETIEQQVRAMRTQAVEGTIDGMVQSGRVQDARAYFNGVKGSIDADRHDEIEKTLKAGAVRKEAQTETERILTTTANFDEQRKLAKQISDADVQDEVLQRIEHERAVKDKLDEDRKRDLDKSISDILDRTKSIQSIPPQQWKQLSRAERSAAVSYVTQLIEFGDVKVTNRAPWLGEIEKANADPLTWAKSFKPLALLDKIPKADMTDLVNLQQSILAGDRKGAQGAIDGLLSNYQVMTEQLKLAGIDTEAKPDTPEGKVRATMLTEIDREVQRRQTTSGKKLTNDEIRQVVDDLTIETITRPGTGSLYDALNPFTERTMGNVMGRTAEALAEIPAGERALIEQAIRETGGNASPRRVLYEWRLRQRANSGGGP